MSLIDLQYPKSYEYRTGTENEPINFFIDAFSNSIKADILLGYFSTSAINTLSLSFAKFISSGGEIRFIINNVLSSKDKYVLQKAEEDDKVHEIDLNNISKLAKTLDEYSVHFFECISYLIRQHRISFQIIKPTESSGISHYKSGLFTDKNSNKVRFKGSANFTAAALLQNLEEIDIKVSWDNSDFTAIEEYERFYESIFTKKAEFVDYVSIDEVEEAILSSFNIKDVNELLLDELDLLKKRKFMESTNKRLQRSLSELEEEIIEYKRTPRFPFSTGPRQYQIDAHANWLANGKKGIFAMATGTGKTITALNCLLNEYKSDGCYRAIILAPTNTLVAQWEKEASKFNFGRVIKVSSKYNWEDDLSILITSLEFGGDDSYIIITTYASFYRQRFQYFFKSLPKGTLLIADEAHNIASPKVLTTFPNVHLQKRIALSATPKRVYDIEGSSKMEEFFNDKEPYTYNFSMERAINEGVLCKYNYYPKIVKLSELELQEYYEISSKLAKFFSSESDGFLDNEIVSQLLMKRKRIIHKAENKLAVFENIIKQEESNRGALKYTLVYVPEGYVSPEEDDSDEEVHIINQYCQSILRANPNTKISKFLGNTENKDSILNLFSDGKIDILASMKCLDEGVDVPRTELAIFCASTGNPRQFIQRRGRVLRTHPDKHIATIYDLVVIPDSANQNEGYFKIERNLLAKELERVAHFAFMSLNRYEAIAEFEEICNYYDLSLYSIHETLSSDH